MKKNLLTRLILILFATINSFYSPNLKAQNFVIVPNPNGIKGGVSTKKIEYNGKLYFEFLSSGGNQLAKYDGTTITLISGSDSNYCQPCNPVIFNNKLCFDYTGGTIIHQLGEYDGTTLSHIPITIPGFSIMFQKIAFNDTLFFTYNYQSNQIYVPTSSKLGVFDGSNFSTVPGPVGVDSLVYQASGSLILNNNLYTFYLNISSGAISLAKYNGHNFSLIPNPNKGAGVVGGFVEYKGDFYFAYSNALSGTGRGMTQLAKFDGTSISLIPGLTGSELSPLSSPIVYNNMLCMFYKNAAGVYQLAQYDGTNLMLIPNPDASIDSVNFAFINYNNNLYFKYKNASGTYQLAQYNGKSITLIPNPDSGLGYQDAEQNFYSYNFYPIVANNNLYINYTDTLHRRRLGRFDENNLTLLPNTGYFGGAALYNDKLYFNYLDSLGYTRLAYLDDRTLPINLLNFTGQLQVNDAFLQWQTATEQNTNHFTIQRSKDGISFSDIGTVKASGSSTSVRSYNYTDPAVIKLGAQKLFYRLEEVDNDGKKQLSNIVSINITGSNNQIVMYPNPAKNRVYFDLPQQLSQNAQIVLYDINGRKVAQQQPQSDNLHQQLNVNNQPQGSYNLKVIDNGKTIFTGKVIILR